MRARIGLAAFLNQPIIPHGHHQDCAGGLDLLAHVANEINSLGEVIWSDLTSISRSNYLTRRVAETLFVKMLSRRISVQLDESVKEIVVERPWINAGRRSGTTCLPARRSQFFRRPIRTRELRCLL